MKTLHLYITRQTLATTVMTVGVFTFVLLLGNAMQQIFTLLLNDQVTVRTIFWAIALLIPYVLVFALPMGLLTAMLLTFGRLSAERELMAIRSGGVSLLALISPLLLLALAFSAVCAYINMDLAPRCRNHYKDLLHEMSTKRPTAIFSEGTFVKDINGFIFYIGKIKGDDMQNVLISQLDAKGDVTMNLRAVRGLLLKTQDTNQFNLRLFDSTVSQLQNGIWQPRYVGEFDLPLTLSKDSGRKLKLNEMPFFTLREELKRLERAQRRTASLTGLDSAQLRQKLVEDQQPGVDLTTPIRVEMNVQLSFSFACIGFTLIGIPLGIQSHRKETSVGIAISLVLVALYWSFFIVSYSLNTKSNWHPDLICWLPNFLFQGIGAVMLWKVNRS